MAAPVTARFVGGPLHGITAALDAGTRSYWHPLPSGEVVSYGMRKGLAGEELWAPIGMSESVFLAHLSELAKGNRLATA